MHRHVTIWLLVIDLIAWCMLQSASAAKNQKIALIIGNGSYKYAPLRNPPNDASDMAKLLRQLGFQVTSRLNVSKREMEKAINTFGRKLRDGGVGLFYFAGHGVQVNGINYLIPIGANIETQGDVQYEAVNANRVLSKMQDAGNPLNMVFLDACRNNPFARRFRSAEQGLAPMDAPKGSFMAYATAPGDVAAEGSGRNGIFTKHLLRQMAAPGLEIAPMMRRVRVGVQKDTEGKQTPFEVSSLTGNFYFNPGKTISPEEPLKIEKPVLPQESDASFDDLLKESEAKRKAVQSWHLWQEAREVEYRQANEIDRDRYLNPQKKAIAWKRFLFAVSQDNPYSEKDDQMRAYSRSRIQHWQKEGKETTVAAISPSVTDAKVAARDGYYEKLTNGIVRDTKTGLEWYAGPDKGTNWNEAKAWVDSLNIDGGGWRMPTRTELKGLYQKGVGSRNMTMLLEITGFIVWSGETEDSSTAWFFHFYSGYESWGYRGSISGNKYGDYHSISSHGRALAVRSRR